MSEIELKEEIKNLVEESSDLSFLNGIKNLFEEERLRKVLSARAEKAEAYIKAGRILSIDEVEERLSKY